MQKTMDVSRAADMHCNTEAPPSPPMLILDSSNPDSADHPRGVLSHAVTSSMHACTVYNINHIKTILKWKIDLGIKINNRQTSNLN